MIRDMLRLAAIELRWIACTVVCTAILAGAVQHPSAWFKPRTSRTHTVRPPRPPKFKTLPLHRMHGDNIRVHVA